MQKLQRIYGAEAYQTERPVGSYWETTTPGATIYPRLESDLRTDVVIVGAGYTGLSAALHLARDHATSAVVIDAAQPGWGASGRNGGFCGFGGTKLSDSAIAKRYGEDDLRAFYGAQSEAIDLVRSLGTDHQIEYDATDSGEFCLAHSRSAVCELQGIADGFRSMTGLDCPIYSPEELKEQGVYSDSFLGGTVIPKAFGLNPRKYILGLADAACSAGATIYGDTPALKIDENTDGTYTISTPQATIIADHLIMACNGYNSENVPDWLGGRFLPVVSHIMVTRPLTEDERQSQGWTSTRIAYDTRYLLHYFRLLPDGRVLFGKRGTSNITPSSMDRMRGQIRIDFESMFPALSGCETEKHWSGLVCLTQGLTPYAGRIGNWQRAWTGFAYHGSGVAMATYTGRLLAGLAMNRPYDCPYPRLMQASPKRFALPRLRRHYLPLAYAYYGLKDRL